MKTPMNFLLSGVLSFFLASCTTSKDMLKPTGDIINIETTDKKTHVGEFLFTQDSIVYVLMDRESKRGEGVFSIPLSSIISMRTTGYANRKWQNSFIIFQLVPTAVFAIETAANVDRVDWGIFLLILGTPSLITYLFLEGSTPPEPEVKAPFYKLDEFLKYSRYPQGLDPNKLSEFLKLYHQTEVENLP